MAYAGDCVVAGTGEMGDDQRLSDFLNQSDLLVLADVALEAHDDGHVVRLESLALSTDELYAVEAVGSRGSTERRRHTRAEPVRLVMGPYDVVGLVHGPSAGDPLAALARASTMVPITRARISYHHAGVDHSRDADVLLVNRAMITSAERSAVDDAPVLREIGLGPRDPRAKDMTGAIYSPPVPLPDDPTGPS
jgi:hypothetical protein